MQRRQDVVRVRVRVRVHAFGRNRESWEPDLILRRSLTHYLSADKKIAALLLLCEQNHFIEKVTFELLQHHVLLANQLDTLDHR